MSGERPRQQVSGSGSHTQVQTRVEAPSGSATQTRTTAPALSAPAILRLRGAHPPSAHRVQWAEDVVDNEGLGRKSSKGLFATARVRSGVSVTLLMATRP